MTSATSSLDKLPPHIKDRLDPRLLQALSQNPTTSSTPTSEPDNQARQLGFTRWLELYHPKHRTDWAHTKALRKQLLRVTHGEVDRLAVALPAQHGKTQSVTVAYAAWRMLRDPGLRVGVGSHTQRYANKISKWIKRMVLASGATIGTDARADEWSLTNGSTMIARGVGGSIAGESIDLFLMDDVFGSREDADSAAVQERVYEWYMDDVTPRLQEHAALIAVNTRWNPGDLIGRIQQSEEWPEWVYLRIPAIAETQEERDRNNQSQGLPAGLPDFISREPGQPLCEERFSLAKLLQKQRIEGVGFEAIYQQNPIPRGGTFFERRWFLGADGKPALKSLDLLPIMSPMPFGRRLVRYWDLAASRNDSACYTSGVLLLKLGEGEHVEYWVVDVKRGRWMPAERNEIMRQTAERDSLIPGYEKAWFEQPVFDKSRSASRAIYAAMSGYAVSADSVSNQGSKELRAEPVAGAAKGGLIKVLDGGWVPAFLTEVESFPRSTYKDQVDSLSGAYNRLSRGGFAAATG
jgi:predicted phage terminase large subunit-like protein